MADRYDREAADLQARLDAARARSEVVYEKSALKKDIRKRVTAIVNGGEAGDVFYKNILNHMVVHKDRRVEVRLNLLPQTWTFVLERLGQSAHYDPDLPMSVSRPFSSG